MKLLDKIKNAIFEDEEIEEIEQEEKEAEKQKQPVEEIARQIDIEKTIPKRETLTLEDDLDLTDDEEPTSFKAREHRKTPVVFDDEDFMMEEENMSASRAYYDDEEEEQEEIPKKHLYGGYRDDKPREKFKPSPILSPVYGFVKSEEIPKEKPMPKKKKSLDEMFKNDRKEKVTIDKVREKAFGSVSPDEEDESLLYDMKSDDTPAISKITIGDAEEYFEDLGLEYNVDYKDSAKEKDTLKKEQKEELKTEEQVVSDLELPELEDIPNLEETGPIEQVEDLEITKEQLKPKSAEEIKKVKKITDVQLEPDSVIDEEQPDEKNLYDLIDMMYESKE